MSSRLNFLLVLLLGVSSLNVAAAEWSVSRAQKDPPAELDEGFRGLLDPNSYQVSEGGKVAFEFWLVREVPLSGTPDSPARALEQIPQTAVLGAVRVLQDRRDYRDKELFADIYTIRMGFQPQDGDHLGTSDFTYFMVLIPAKLDRSPDGIKTYKAMVDASGKETPSGHPVILSLRPVEETTGEFPTITQPAADHTAVRLKLPGKVANENAPAELVFDLVVKGTATLH